MAKVLYITAHPHNETHSYSMAVGKEFIEAYKQENKDDEVVKIDLYKEDIPQIDADVFSGWGRLQKPILIRLPLQVKRSDIRTTDQLVY